MFCAVCCAVSRCVSGGPPKLDPVTAVVQKIRDYGYMHMDQWEVLLSITAKAMLAAEVGGCLGVVGVQGVVGLGWHVCNCLLQIFVILSPLPALSLVPSTSQPPTLVLCVLRPLPAPIPPLPPTHTHPLC